MVPRRRPFCRGRNFLGRSLCSWRRSSRKRKTISIVGVDTCRGSGPRAPREGLSRRGCGRGGGPSQAPCTATSSMRLCRTDLLLVTDSITASTFSRIIRSSGSIWMPATIAKACRPTSPPVPKVKPGGWLSGDDYDDSNGRRGAHGDEPPAGSRAVVDQPVEMGGSMSVCFCTLAIHARIANARGCCAPTWRRADGRSDRCAVGFRRLAVRAIAHADGANGDRLPSVSRRLASTEARRIRQAIRDPGGPGD